MPEIWQATEAGSFLEFKFKGTYIAIYDILGPDSGVIEVELNGEKQSYKRIDKYSTYHRPTMLTVRRNLDNKIHHVKIKLTDKKIDKRKILKEENRHKFDEKPEIYKAHNWYIGGIFLDGRLID